MSLISNQLTKYPIGSRKEMSALYEDGMKRCSSCKHILELDKFSAKKIKKVTGYPYRSSCKECENEAQRKKRELDIKRECKYCGKQGIGDKSKKFFTSNEGSKKIISVCLECEHIDIERKTREAKSRALSYNYDITIEEYESLLKMQNYKCGICGTTDYGKYLFVDHCHDTGEIRGLLCKKCNSGIGLLGDNEEGLLKAYLYLKGNLNVN